MTENEIRERILSVTRDQQQSQLPSQTHTKPRDLSHYQVVRREYGSSPDEIQITFNRGRLYINSYGLSRFPQENYIQVLVDEDTQSAVIKPSIKKKRDSFLWCGGMKKRKPRHISCIPLCYLVFRMMNWDWDARYRITGEIEDYGEERVIFLDLRSAVCFVREQTGDGIAGKTSTHMKMPQDWANSFGMPYEDYSKRQDIKTFDEMSVFNVELLMKRDKVSRIQELKEEKERDAAKADGNNAGEEEKMDSEVVEAGDGANEEG